jgi:hypothetical protein
MLILRTTVGGCEAIRKGEILEYQLMVGFRIGDKELMVC